MLYPLTFHPVFKERVWGGRELARLYGKALPPDVPIGESWEITDRPEGVSVIANGPLAGKDLRWLMERHAEEVLGAAQPLHGRFPLLCKILDAREKLSLQVHPPADKAASLGGEPKTEAWYVADASEGAEIFTGLKQGITRNEFERRLQNGTVADCFHRHSVRRGDAMFLPSSRVHALGGGNVIFEIQQNSDTTYRVFDWNRVGLDGKPRELHVAQAMECIDFEDFEPPLVDREGMLPESRLQLVEIASTPEFTVTLHRANGAGSQFLDTPSATVLAALEGEVTLQGGDSAVGLRAGDFALLPASLRRVEVRHNSAAAFLVAVPH
jgi:mannose-6-phosphate isomerase